MHLIGVMTRIIIESLSNITLLTSLVSMTVAQVIKVIYYRIVEKKFNFHHFFEAGGMPSSHSALVCALSAMVGLSAGFDSIVFAAVVIFSSIVMYDAIKVRAEEVGHTIVEVAIGGLLGFIISLIFYLKFF